MKRMLFGCFKMVQVVIKWQPYTCSMRCIHLDDCTPYALLTMWGMSCLAHISDNSSNLQNYRKKHVHFSHFINKNQLCTIDHATAIRTVLGKFWFPRGTRLYLDCLYSFGTALLLQPRFHPSIHFHKPLIPGQGCELPEPIPACSGKEAGIQLGCQSIPGPTHHSLTFIATDNLEQGCQTQSQEGQVSAGFCGFLSISCQLRPADQGVSIL